MFSEPLPIAMDRARCIFEGLFENSDVHHSPSGRGWWMKHVPSNEAALSLIAVFDAPKRAGLPTAFSAAFLGLNA
ncbi:MAG: hypothetical protein JSS20_07240 [Proteobacteria bacterium]|nr:hypothetical protein [Pseudomonadota bacterium]